MAFDLDDLDPKHKKPQPKNLDAMNIEEYAAALTAELARVDDKIKAKQSHAAAAASFFKK